MRECSHIPLRIHELEAIKQPLTKRSGSYSLKPRLLALAVRHVLPEGETHGNFHAEELRDPLRTGVKLRDEGILFSLCRGLLLCCLNARGSCFFPLLQTHLELRNLHLLRKGCILEGKDRVAVLELLQLTACNLADVANLSFP